MKVIIIGSGLSGLTGGAVLAQAGHEVAIFEQYHQVGDVTLLFERDGFHWDFGQLLVEGFGPQEPVGQILRNWFLRIKSACARVTAATSSPILKSKNRPSLAGYAGKSKN